MSSHADDGMWMRVFNKTDVLCSGTVPFFKEGLYRIWCGVNRLGDSGVHTLGNTSAFVNPAC